jgi:predicted enzyme related to lactoylglutathione lyase
MGQPVVHFEVIGKDGEKLQAYYSDLFGWQIDSDNPMRYGTVQRMMGPDEPMPGLVIGLFQDPEGHLVGVVSGGS